METIISNDNRPEAYPPELWVSVFRNYPVYRILLEQLGRKRRTSISCLIHGESNHAHFI